MPKRRICVVTGSRAEYGLLYPLLCALRDDIDFELQIIAAAAHLSPEFGLTYQVIERDGFRIDARVEMLLSSDTPVGIAKSIGLGVIGFAEAYDRLRPDLLVLLGDRFEVLAAAEAALVARLPIAHIAGGDTTEGAFDEAIRHSVTKMSHLHFATHEKAAARIRQLGENPECVFNVGSLGIDAIQQLSLLSRGEVEKRLRFRLRSANLLITFHPVTLRPDYGCGEFVQLLLALDRLGGDVGLIFTKPNADTYSRKLIQTLEEFAAPRPNVSVHTSLGQVQYLSTMSHADAVVGNSSSALYEAPTLKKPAVDIGDRQRGRLQPDSTIHSEPFADAIYDAIQQALRLDCSQTVNPYGDGHSVQRIMAVLKSNFNTQKLVEKRFVSIDS
jgi:UDP-N-acetylglucosamine 2-epimerase (non-hydrolysing)/GDP/UDP-N,N'-diacetylbacillosamine 2-epimerase (hydrolysing)